MKEAKKKAHICNSPCIALYITLNLTLTLLTQEQFVSLERILFRKLLRKLPQPLPIWNMLEWCVHTLLREEDRVNTGRKRTEDDDMEGNY